MTSSIGSREVARKRLHELQQLRRASGGIGSGTAVNGAASRSIAATWPVVVMLVQGFHTGVMGYTYTHDANADHPRADVSERWKIAMKDALPFQRRNLPDNVGRLLRQAREARGASRRAVADVIGIRPRTLARIERGEQKPLWTTLDRLCDELGVSAFTIARCWAQESFDLPVDPEEAPGLGLRALRLARGMTLEDLADRSGISAATLSRYERGLTRSRLLAEPTNGLKMESEYHGVPNKMLDLALALGFRTVADLTRACLMAYGD